MSELVTRSFLSTPADEVFAWHEQPGALERLTPPWEKVRVLARSGTIHDGDWVELQMGFRRRWRALHFGYQAGRQFCDRQVRGPFARFSHQHRMIPRGGAASVMEDRVEYELPAGALGRAVAGGWVERRLQRMFTYRHALLAADLEQHGRFRSRERLRVAVTGASGLLGSALVAFLSTGGHSVTRIVRGPAGDRDISWNPDKNQLDAAALEGFDAVVHLAGESVAGRWTRARKRRILDSRVDGTFLLSETLARLKNPPRVLISASAVGYYGPRSEPVDEQSEPGDDFLAQVCRAWEAATEPARLAGVRVVNTRFGVVLTPAGGALSRLLPPFKLGIGGPLGDGRQPFSWISLDDAVYAVHHALYDTRAAGPLNLVAPEPVNNAQLTTTLGRVLHRPAWLPVPAAAVKLVAGEMGRSMLLSGAEVVPAGLAALGFNFAHPSLEEALRHLLGRAGELTAEQRLLEA